MPLKDPKMKSLVRSFIGPVVLILDLGADIGFQSGGGDNFFFQETNTSEIATTNKSLN